MGVGALHRLPDCVSVLVCPCAVAFGSPVLVLASTRLVDGMNPANLPRLILKRDRDAVSTKLDHAPFHLLCLAFHVLPFVALLPHYTILSTKVNPNLDAFSKNPKVFLLTAPN